MLTAFERRPGRPYVESYRMRGSLDTDAKRPPALIEMVYVRGGAFTMGSLPDETGRHDAEGPAHEVEVLDFWMSKYEITWDQFYRFWRSDDSADFKTPANYYADPDPGGVGPREKRPAVAETQYCAQVYCRWLSAVTGRHYRLPTEAEWEYAARAGSNARWSFGEDEAKLEEYAWYGEKFSTGLHPVGQKKPNAFGLHDMYGNAAEWVLDGWSSDYSHFAGRRTLDPWVMRADDAPAGVAKGGDWTSTADQTRSAARRRRADLWAFHEDFWQWCDTTPQGQRVGFRIVSPVRKEVDDRARSVKPFPEKLRMSELAKERDRARGQ